MTRAEQETIIRWDRAERKVYLYTADPIEARRWERAGYRFTKRTCGFFATGPAGCVRLRRVRDGAIVKRPGRVPSPHVQRHSERRTPPGKGETPSPTDWPETGP